MANSHNLRICFITGTLGRGGAERQLVYMLRALKNAGVQTRVLCLTKGEPVEEEIKAMGIQVTWVGRSRWRPIRLIRIIRELLADRPDLVQSSHFYTNMYAAVAGALLRIKSIGAIRNDLTSEVQSHGKIGWAQLHLPAHLIANSQLARSRAIAQGINPERVDMISNVVAPDDHVRSKSKNNDAIRILFAARLTQQKRPDRFLTTLRNVNSVRPDLKFTATIAGDGPLRSELHGLAAQLGLTERQVEFLGELKDVRPFYHKSDFLMLTSDWEGTPNVLLEAMACGLPVVATNVGGVPEIVDSNRGLIVEAGDDDGLTAATIRMIENSKLRTALGNHGLEYVSRHHSLAALQDRLINVYAKLLPRRLLRPTGFARKSPFPPAEQA